MGGTVAAVYGSVNELRWGGLFPTLFTAAERKRGSAQPQDKEGWLRHQENIAKPPAKRKRDSAQPQVKLTQPGWFSFVFSFGKPPRPRYQRMLRGILLAARPPLLVLRLRAAALALRGGDARRGIRSFQFVHTFCEGNT